jgi:hypothetical protein
MQECRVADDSHGPPRDLAFDVVVIDHRGAMREADRLQRQDAAQ